MRTKRIMRRIRKVKRKVMPSFVIFEGSFSQGKIVLRLLMKIVCEAKENTLIASYRKTVVHGKDKGRGKQQHGILKVAMHFVLAQ